jgi:hypothetical protein
MQKKIVSISKTFHGHLILELEDGFKQTVFRGDHEIHAPKVGDLWPPDGHEHVASGVQTGALLKKG